MSTQYDKHLSKLLQVHKAVGPQGERVFAETLLSYLRRHTSMLSSEENVAKVQAILNKQVELDRLEKQHKQEAAASKAPVAASSAASVVSEAEDEAKESVAPAPPKAAVQPEEAKEKAKAEEESNEESDDESEKGIKGNGGVTDKYSWTQTLKDLVVTYPVPQQTRAKDVDVEFDVDSMRVTVAGETLSAGPLFNAVDPEECTWTLDTEAGQRVLQVFLAKTNTMEWWSYVIKGDPAIDVKRIVPVDSKLEDLDPDTRATVEKMMFDQRQRAAGLPTSDEMQKRAALERFMALHPEMDFSQAKINLN